MTTGPRPPVHGSSIRSAATPDSRRPLPLRTRLSMFVRLLAIQGSWNYETLLGNGIGFSVEPALRMLPEGRAGSAYRAALARESRYFNSHPYLAGVAVGALARAEVDGVAPEKIERFRTACCGPLGSVGDRLVWAGWLPFCSLGALVAFGLGASPWLVVVLFLVAYNTGHIALRAWGLDAGWNRGLKVAAALGNPVLRRGPHYIAQAAAVLAGVALPLALSRLLGAGQSLLGPVMIAVVVGAIVLARLHGRVQGWRIALGAIAVLVLISVIVA
ncbi:MAG: PTS system mannose/fructose/sorbose family transporter subunit IID [Gemmatimonadaceae bacterium]